MVGRGRRQPSRLASLLFVVGCLAVLATTFMLGVMAGRFWPREPSAPTSTLAKGSKEAAAARLGGDRSARPTEPAPTLTFYQDLTAPLTSPPPPPKSTRPARVDRSDKLDAAPRPEAAPTAELPKAGTAFTVQVGRTRRGSPRTRCARASPPRASRPTSPTSTPPPESGSECASARSRRVPPRRRSPTGSVARARFRRTSRPSEMAPSALGRVLVSADALKARVAELGRAIARDYAGASPVLVGVLQGAVPFLADLMRELPLDLTVDFLRASSYGSGTNSSGAVRLLSDLTVDIKGRPVLLVDDIVDTGLTLAVLKRTLEARGPLSVRTCVLLDKQGRRQTEIDVDYVGFTIPNVFVVGYGLDYDGLYRNLPYVATLDAT